MGPINTMVLIPQMMEWPLPPKPILTLFASVEELLQHEEFKGSLDWCSFCWSTSLASSLGTKRPCLSHRENIVCLGSPAGP